MIDMAEKNITPAVIAFVNSLSEAALAKKQLSASYSVHAETTLIEELSMTLESFVKKTAALKAAVTNAALYNNDPLKLATYYRETVFALMAELRVLGDTLETKTAKSAWPYPSYGDILFGV